MTHEQLMKITRTLPMRVIEVRGEPYLERYFLGSDKNGTQEWLHRFLRADSEEHLHSHPWDADSTVLCGWYVEQMIRPSGALHTRELHEGHTNTITPDKLHRVIDAQPNTWTHIRVYAGREPTWFFINSKNEKQIMQSSPVDWWRNCEARKS